MTILASDIQLMESERMRDTSDGGGRQTGEVIVSGEVGNIFPKISRLDAVYGRVNLRKVYLAVRTANNDVYAGAHAIVSAPPENGRVSCLLFSTESAFDDRDDARDRIESYVVAGPLSRMRLYGNQLVGQQAILTYQKESEPLPDVGSVIVLSTENSSGVVSASQYVRITDITHEMRTFTDDNGDFSMRVITLKIGSRLNTSFAANEVSRFSTDSSATKIRVTQVADASQYYGLMPTTEASNIGDLSLRLSSVYGALVPSTNRETGISLASIAGVISVIPAMSTEYTKTLTSSGYNNVQFIGSSTSGGLSLQLASGLKPGSVTVLVNTTYSSWTDDGDGGLVYSGPGGPGGGEVNYETGVIRLWCANPSYPPTTTWVATFVSAASVSSPAHTIQVPITLATRGSVYAATLSPIPAPGTLIVDFRALGRWYRLRDNGSGELEANDPSEGTGSVDYVTGAVVVTLGALPDVDSAVIMSWGSPAHTTIRAGATADAGTTLDIDYTLAHAPIVPGSVTISYPVNAVSRDVTDSAGVLTGTGVTGTINYTTGAISLRFSTPPDASANLSNAYTWRDGADLIGGGTTATITANAFTVPGTAPFLSSGTMIFSAENYHDGAPLVMSGYITSGGQVRVTSGRGVDGYGQGVFWADQQIGTFNTSSGVVSLTTGNVSISDTRWSRVAGKWSGITQNKAILAVSDIAVERDTASFDPQAVTGETVSAASIGLKIDLTTVSDVIVPGSVMLTATGKTYVDRNGTLYADVSPTTGSGTAAGSINYTTGVCTLTYWTSNAAVSRTVNACLTQYGDFSAVDASFRTSGSPLRPASLYVQVTAADGTLVTGTADSNGVVTGTYMRGNVQQDMGVVFVEFGEMVTAAGNEAEDWYDEDNVVGGEIWRPLEVMPGTLRYNCVVITNLPLDPDILGLDPVRLPSDGRVPIYRPGDTVVIHHTDTTALTNPVAADGVYSVGRANLYSCTLADATGAAVSDALYSVDLAAGEITIDSAWTGSGITQPLTATHRVEQMALLSDVQINGQIEIAAEGGLAHEFPAGETYVSSALMFGDLQAIVTNVFDQSTWTSVWSDTVIGSVATATFDDINYPITCLNESAVTERWRINFTSSTAFQVIGENLGVIATGTTSTATAPVNPVTSEPYFNIPAGGWGAGWSTGNQLRFNTQGASGPIWIARTILAGASLEGDQFGFEGRGDLD